MNNWGVRGFDYDRNDIKNHYSIASSITEEHDKLRELLELLGEELETKLAVFVESLITTVKSKKCKIGWIYYQLIEWCKEHKQGFLLAQLLYNSIESGWRIWAKEVAGEE